MPARIAPVANCSSRTSRWVSTIGAAVGRLRLRGQEEGRLAVVRRPRGGAGRAARRRAVRRAAAAGPRA